MKPFLIAASLLIGVLAKCQTNWEKVMLDNAVSIAFPLKPVQGGNDANKSFILKLADSTANFIVAVTDLETTRGIDAATLQAAMEQEESWEQAKVAFMASMGSSAKLVKNEMTTVQNLNAMLLEIDRKSDKGDTNNLSVLIFVNGTKSYNIIFNNRGGKADKSLKEQFFKSIEVK